MSNRVLFVDDEQHVLASYRRTLRKGWDVVTALGGETALEIFESKGPFAVVVSDMRMPGMNGVQLLTKIKEKDPDTVRMMLTGYADFSTAMEAVNEGNIFRFLTKPCPPELLTQALGEAVRQYELIKSEQELLNKTLRGSIQVLIEILSMVDQQSFSQASKLRDYVRRLAKEKAIAAGWELEIAALLSQVGQVTIPGAVIQKARQQEKLSDVEKNMLARIPKTGHDLVEKIPRLEKIAKIILYQNKHFNGEGYPDEDIKGIDLPAGSRIIKILNDLITLEEQGKLRKDALAEMSTRIGWYDPNLLQIVVNKLVGVSEEKEAVKQETGGVNLDQLESGYVLMENIETDNGQVLMMVGQKITESHILRIKNWSKLYKIKEPIKVLKNVL